MSSVGGKSSPTLLPILELLLLFIFFPPNLFICLRKGCLPWPPMTSLHDRTRIDWPLATFGALGRSSSSSRSSSLPFSLACWLYFKMKKKKCYQEVHPLAVAAAAAAAAARLREEEEAFWDNFGRTCLTLLDLIPASIVDIWLILHFHKSRWNHHLMGVRMRSPNHVQNFFKLPEKWAFAWNSMRASSMQTVTLIILFFPRKDSLF